MGGDEIVRMPRQLGGRDRPDPIGDPIERHDINPDRRNDLADREQRLEHQRDLEKAMNPLLAPRVGSLPVSVGAGLASGGSLATLVCGLAWRHGVPNPRVGGDVAFNIADVAIAVGVGLLIGGALLTSWLERDRLRQPV